MYVSVFVTLHVKLLKPDLRLYTLTELRPHLSPVHTFFCLPTRRYAMSHTFGGSRCCYCCSFCTFFSLLLFLSTHPYAVHTHTQREFFFHFTLVRLCWCVSTPSFFFRIFRHFRVLFRGNLHAIYELHSPLVVDYENFFTLESFNTIYDNFPLLFPCFCFRT